MFRVVLIGFLFLTVGALPLTAQTRYYFVPKDDTSFTHIRDLKDGVLLVRLHTQENSIRLLEAKGRLDDAMTIAQRQHFENENIVKAFGYLFDFCPVYFFYSYHSEWVKHGWYTGVFLNDSLEFDSSIVLPEGTKFLIADFGDVYFEAFGSSVEGVVMMDRTFTPLKRPFPYYVRKRSGMALIRRSESDLVRILNENLHKFYGHTP